MTSVMRSVPGDIHPLMPTTLFWENPEKAPDAALMGPSSELCVVVSGSQKFDTRGYVFVIAPTNVGWVLADRLLR